MGVLDAVLPSERTWTALADAVAGATPRCTPRPAAYSSILVPITTVRSTGSRK